MKKKFLAAACVLGLLAALCTVTAMAAGDGEAVETAEAAYSYEAGQQRSQRRNEVYAEASEIESEEAREAYLEEQEIGEETWSEEAAASYSYVAGRERGASYRTGDAGSNENQDMTAYSYVTGQQRGGSYHK